jgi:hypothetical protein
MDAMTLAFEDKVGVISMSFGTKLGWSEANMSHEPNLS